MKCVQAYNNCHELEEETHYKYYQTLMVVALYLACCLATHKRVDIGRWLSAVAEQGIRGWCIVSMNTQSRVQLPDELGQYSTNIELFHMNISRSPKLCIWDDALDEDVVTAREHNKVAV